MMIRRVKTGRIEDYVVVKEKSVKEVLSQVDGNVECDEHIEEFDIEVVKPALTELV